MEYNSEKKLMCVPIEWIPVARRGKHSTVKHLHSCSNEKQIF